MARKKELAYETEQYTFPSRLRGLMKATGTKQKELAQALGVKPQTVSLYVQGQSFPDVNGLEKIARFFSVSADYLLGRTEVKSPSAEIQAICDYSGLSEDAVAKLHTLLETEKSRAFTVPLLSNIISALDYPMMTQTITDLLLVAVEFIDSGKEENYSGKPTVETDGKVTLSIQDAKKFMIEQLTTMFSNTCRQEATNLIANKIALYYAYQRQMSTTGEGDLTNGEY